MARTPEHWDVEDARFWEGEGRAIANRNLWISIPNLLCAFAVWIYWSMIIKKMQLIHFQHRELFAFGEYLPAGSGDDAYRALLYTLPAVAGLAGATLRIPNSFMIAICGGRNVIFMTTVLLLIPAFATGIALASPDTPFWVFVVLAALSGAGGGAFASSMSNISFFFPKRMQGLALGLNAGLGNAGVSVMQFTIPYAVTMSIFGALAGDPVTVTVGDQSQTLYLANAALIWVPVMAVLAVAAFVGMNNLPAHRCGTTAQGVAKYLWLQGLGYVGVAVGVALLLAAKWVPLPPLLWTFLVLLLTILATLAVMRWGTPRAIQEPLRAQWAIFGNKHNWIMTWLYVMTFGSFIGYSNAFPKLLDDVFFKNAGTGMSDRYAWIGPFVGALIRPVGGWLSDKFGGARVTQWDTWVMVGATILAGYFVYVARQSDHPETYFIPFLITFIVLFATTGIGNGSTFRMIPIIFEKDQAGPVLGWTSAVAAYGAYLIPKIFGQQIKAGTPELALYGFAVYYASCLVVNWYYYARRNAEIHC